VTVLGGATGPAGGWARATRGATTTAPATTPMPVMSVRRDITPLSVASFAMTTS